MIRVRIQLQLSRCRRVGSQLPGFDVRYATDGPGGEITGSLSLADSTLVSAEPLEGAVSHDQRGLTISRTETSARLFKLVPTLLPARRQRGALRAAGFLN